MPTIKTFRAKSLPDAIAQIRRDLGPDASVLHTREVSGGLLGRLLGARGIEVAASAEVVAPSRFAPPQPPIASHAVSPIEPTASGLILDDEAKSGGAEPPPALSDDHHNTRPPRFSAPSDAGLALDETESPAGQPRGFTDALFAVFTDLIEADVDETLARRLLNELRRQSEPDELDNAERLRSQLPSLLEQRFTTSGPIENGRGRRFVALVGPTGVGKTTTIAKLAANLRLREGKRVGLITVDTYRVAAVEQLRTYADIIDLPMEVVSTPREMREAVDRLAGLGLVLLDTAGRSPRDEVQLQELRSMLAEAAPDEVHLVLSATAGVKQLAATADRFKPIGVTSLMLTKLDEAAAFGHLVSLAEDTALPISYTTNGQNVPDDIEVATPQSLARLVLG